MKLLSITILLFTIFENRLIETNDDLSNKLIKEIRSANLNHEFGQDDFFRIDHLLKDYPISNGLSLVRNSPEYKNSICTFLNSPNENKRVFAYRLIGVAKDHNFDDVLIERLHSDESSLLKTCCATTLMTNEVQEASDDLFQLLSSSSSGLPLDILIDRYVEYDTNAVKKSCWKYMHSTSRSEQIMSIQILANFECDHKLQSKLIDFLEEWEDEYKGWVISSMALQKMSHLKPILSKYYEFEFLKGIIIEALEVSPSKEDNIYAQELKRLN
ncbi:hypothetical protein [Flammeovirga sp. EKP202]|uniref:hypothetical protein n=1 Tax=Flammeovirga sp. EKP202 TaxID=2770592 RepID=UPI00165FA7DA|nr:hypothetical protein [Flammeovirga sp. EKP202]MBD0401232.1 hypothetical protein [Flammeovirga sp. EKP202]